MYIDDQEEVQYTKMHLYRLPLDVKSLRIENITKLRNLHIT